MTSDPPLPDDAKLSPGRVRRVLGPIVGGMILDLVDLATFGPAGLYGGFVLAALVGWWLGGQAGWSRRGRALFALGAAIYAATPATEALPLGTLVGVLMRILGR